MDHLEPRGLAESTWLREGRGKSWAVHSTGGAQQLMPVEPAPCPLPGRNGKRQEHEHPPDSRKKKKKIPRMGAEWATAELCTFALNTSLARHGLTRPGFYVWTYICANNRPDSETELR